MKVNYNKKDMEVSYETAREMLEQGGKITFENRDGYPMGAMPLIKANSTLEFGGKTYSTACASDEYFPDTLEIGKFFVIETRGGDSWETECSSSEEAIEKAIETYGNLSDYDKKHQTVIAASRKANYEETECYDLQEVFWDSDNLKTVEDMNLSWNYTQVHGESFDYCGNENLAAWLERFMEPDEIYAAIEIADEYVRGLEEDGREPACVIWFD